MDNEILKQDMIKLYDESVTGYSNYYYYCYRLNTGIVIKYRQYEEEIEYFPIDKLFKNNEIFLNCRNAMEFKLVYFKNKLNDNDFSNDKGKKYIEDSIKIIENQIELFQYDYIVFIKKFKHYMRKVKIKHLLEGIKN